MNITITFRQMPASAALTKHVQEKAAKLQKFLRQPMSAKVTLSLDRLKHVAEARISSGGQHLEAKETNDDMYASVDKVIDKLERRIRGMKGTKESKTRRGGATLRGGPPVPPARGTEGASAEQPATAQPRTVRVAIKALPDKPSRAKLPVNRSRGTTRRSQAR
jgi:putative sigma-54 modulation protein